MRLRSFLWFALLGACSASGKGIFPMDGGADDGGKPPTSTPPDEDDGGTRPKDGGKGDGNILSGMDEVTIKNLSFSGSADTGSFTFIVTNGSSKMLETLSEVRIKFSEGEMVFATQCAKLTLGDDLFLAPGATSDVITMNVSYLYYSASGSVTVKCGGSSRSISKTSGASLSSSTSLPESLTLKGIFDDAAKWTATAPVEE